MKKRLLVALSMVAAFTISIYSWNLYKDYQRSSDPYYMARLCVHEQMVAYKTGDFQKAFKICKDAAFIADIEMQEKEIENKKIERLSQIFYDGAFTALGLMYMEGRGTTTDPVNGLRWLRKAAKRNLRAALYLYNLYAFGDEDLGIKKNPYVALNWLRKAAELGDNDSMFLLGNAYAGEGKIIKKDINESGKWFYKCGLSWLDTASAYLDLDFDPNPNMADESLAKAEKCLNSLKKLTPDKYRTYLINDLEQKISTFKSEIRDAFPNYQSK